MISVGLETIAFLYVAGTLLVIAGVWLIHAWLRSRAFKNLRRNRIQCALCGTEYESEDATELPACPVCAHQNERVTPPLF